MSQCGIGSILNKNDEKFYIFKSKDLMKTWENYHALLNSNYHHNAELQNDWNELGSSNFVFEILEITADNEEDMNQILNKHLDNHENVYKDVKVDNIPFIYKTQMLLDDLYNQIGETQINPIFLNKLDINNVEESYYVQIKKDAEARIKSGEVKIGEVGKLLDDLIAEIIKDKQQELETKRENQLDELYKLTGKTKIIKKYQQLLEKNGLSNEIGLEIKNEIKDLINDDALEGSVKDKFDELIQEKKHIEDEKLKAELLSKLHDLTGDLDLTEEYVEKLQIKGLTPELGFIIRQNIKKDIQEGNIRDESIEDILNNLIDEECERLAQENENKLLDYLNDLIGKNQLNSEFKSRLDSLTLNSELGFEIKNEVQSLIKNRDITNERGVDSKIDELIEIEVIKVTKIKKELLGQLHNITGEDELNDNFKSKLDSYKISEEWGISLIKSLENDVSDNKIQEGFDFKSHIDEECKKFDSNREINLTEYLYDLTGKAKLSSKFKSKLDLFGIDSEVGFKIKDTVYNLIKNRDIIEKSEIDSKIDELIEIEVIKVTKIKEELFSQLHEIIGEDNLNDEFKSKLDSYNIDEEWGLSLLDSLENDITTHKIHKGFDFKSHIDDLIIDKKVSDLTENINHIFNNTHLDSKLNENFLNDKDGTEIKSELIKIIESRDIDTLIDLENNNLEKEVNNRILQRHDDIKDEVADLRENLLGDLYLLVKENYEPKVKSYELHQETVDKIKQHIEEVIKKDEIFDSKFKYKIDELRALNTKTVKNEFVSLLTEEKRIENEKLDKLRKELKSDLSLLFSDFPTSFININLKKYELSEKYKSRAENRIIQIIDSNSIHNKKFNYKIEELTYYKQNSFKDEIIKILEEFKAIIDSKLDKLYEITGKDTLKDSFKNSLTSKGLSEQAGWKIVSEIKEDILNEKPVPNIQSRINTRLNQMEIDKNESIVLLEDKVGIDAGKLLFKARLVKRNLNTDVHGMNIKMNMETLIQNGDVNSDNFDNVLKNELDNEVIRKNNRLREVTCNIIGLNKVNDSFLTKIKPYNLTEQDALKIKEEVLNSINNNELKEGEVNKLIDDLIISKGNARTTELIINKANSIMGKSSISPEFSKILSTHDLDNSDGMKIKQKIIQQINRGQINLDNLEQSIEKEIQDLDNDYVKNELDKLSGNSIDKIMKKHSLSRLLPLKAAKIGKLMDNVPLSDLKVDLAEFGSVRYRIKYGSGVSDSNQQDEVHNFCANCGAKLDKGSIYCSECGTKVE